MSSHRHSSSFKPKCKLSSSKVVSPVLEVCPRRFGTVTCPPWSKSGLRRALPDRVPLAASNRLATKTTRKTTTTPAWPPSHTHAPKTSRASAPCSYPSSLAFWSSSPYHSHCVIVSKWFKSMNGPSYLD